MPVAHRLMDGREHLGEWKDLAQALYRCVIRPLDEVDLAQTSLLTRVSDRVQEGERIKERVSDAGIRPVEIDGVAVLYGDISGMQVTMDQRLRDGVIGQVVAQSLQLWTLGAELLDFTAVHIV